MKTVIRGKTVIAAIRSKTVKLRGVERKLRKDSSYKKK